MRLGVVILAAGLGKRMQSIRPKVLHELAGSPMIWHVIELVCKVFLKNTNEPDLRKIFVVLGFGADQVRTTILDRVPPALIDPLLHQKRLIFIEQPEPLGTGHAVLQTVNHYVPEGLDKILVLYGDVPCIQSTTLQKLLKNACNNNIVLLTTLVANPQGFGRIVRDPATRQIIKIVEEKDADSEQRKIQEIWTGALLSDAKLLAEFLPKLTNKNESKELYLTDIVAYGHERGSTIDAVQPDYPFEVFGVNDKLQLAILEREYQYHQACNQTKKGLQIADLNQFNLRGTLVFGTDCHVDIGVIFEGQIELGNGVYIGPYCHLKNVTVASHSVIQSHCVLEGAEVGPHCLVGPFARIRPGTTIAEGVKIGNFVEIKNSHLQDKVKINHLSYVGDAFVGECSNIGAGTITCNYDGKNKHRTEIGQRVSVGANSSLVAPVKIGEGAIIGAGTVLTKDVGPEQIVYNQITRQEKDRK